jgi:transcriptional regulator GlxA family with amidase domain
VLFLSAEGASITDVARTVGYGSVEAMSQAFRLAGLPAPSVVQQALRDIP